MGAPKQPAVTTQISKTELPAWVEQGGQENYDLAKQVADRPYQPYDGQRIADMTDLERSAPGILQGGMDASGNALGASSNILQGIGGYNPQQVTAGNFLSRDINAYMDPNLNNVVKTTMTGMQQQLANSANQNSDAARAAGAFGGSRFAVGDAVLKAQGAQNMAQTEAQLRSQAFTDAANRITQDNQLALQGDISNQNAGLQGQQLRLGAANALTSNAQTASDTAGRNALLMQQFGANERAFNQAGLDQAYQNFLEQRDYPVEQLNTRMAALGMSPYGKTTSTTGTSQNSNSSNNLMTGIGAVATFLPLLFGGSDRKIKKNIRRIGKGPNDLNVYEFEYKDGYKDEPGTGPGRYQGFMADDVKKKVPGAVVKAKDTKGRKFDMVNYTKAATPQIPKSRPASMGGFMGRAA